MEAHYYHTTVTWVNGRVGQLSSPELNDFFAVATPPEFKNGVPNIWSPEHLFTAAINSCFMTTFLAIAENSNFPFQSFRCEAKGKLEMVEGKYQMTEVELLPHVVIADERDREKAERLLQKSDHACLVSNSVKAKVKLTSTVRVEAAALKLV